METYVLTHAAADIDQQLLSPFEAISPPRRKQVTARSTKIEETPISNTGIWESYIRVTRIGEKAGAHVGTACGLSYSPSFPDKGKGKS